MNRDFDQKPYTPDEARVARYWAEEIGIGGGSDPIGALIASHRIIADERRKIFNTKPSENDEHQNIEMEGDGNA